MYKIIKNKKIGDLEKKVEVLIKTIGCIPVGNVNKIEIDGEPMFVQAVYKEVINKSTDSLEVGDTEEDVEREEYQKDISSDSKSETLRGVDMINTFKDLIGEKCIMPEDKEHKWQLLDKEFEVIGKTANFTLDGKAVFLSESIVSHFTSPNGYHNEYCLIISDHNRVVYASENKYHITALCILAKRYIQGAQESLFKILDRIAQDYNIVKR